MKNRKILPALLADIDTGIIVCDAQAKITFFNKAAAKLMNNHLTLGEPVYSFYGRGPIEHALNMARLQADLVHKVSAVVKPGIKFQCASRDENILYNCTIIWFAADNEADSGFAVCMEQAGQANEQVYALHNLIEQLRAQLANLRAAAENLTSHHNLSAVLQSAFENVILHESVSLAEKFVTLSDVCRSIIKSNSKHSEIISSTIIAYLVRQSDDTGIKIVPSAHEPCCLAVDSYSLLLLLQYFVLKINTATGVQEITIAVNRGDKHVYFDFIWPGKPISPSEIDLWLQEPLPQSVGKQKVSNILKQHDSDVWSQPHTTGKSLLRIPLPECRKIAD